MRALLAGLTLALLSCTPPQEATCAITATRDITFTHAETADTVTARSFGDSCLHAIGLYTITAADGSPIWAWATPLARQFGDDFAADSESMRAFLERWSEPTIATTGEAPEWALLAPGQTTLDQLTYADIRARNLPMLCHYSGTARQACVFWEPAAASAGHFLDRDIVEEGEQQ